MLSGSIVMSLEYYTGIRDSRQHRNTAEFWCAEKETRKKKPRIKLNENLTTQKYCWILMCWKWDEHKNHVLNWMRTWNLKQPLSVLIPWQELYTSLHSQYIYRSPILWLCGFYGSVYSRAISSNFCHHILNLTIMTP